MRHVILMMALGMIGCGTSTSATTTAGGSGATGAVNDCDAKSAKDLTGSTTTTINGAGTSWTPACIKVKAGTTVTFAADFTTHPLVGGAVADDGTQSPDSSSPITSMATGTSEAVKFTAAGTFGFYCSVHAGVGMKGAVIVE